MTKTLFTKKGTNKLTRKSIRTFYSLLPGITIVTGTAVGAGMFSLPIISSGMWFEWSILLLICTWFCMFHSSLFIMEANLNYVPGSSFDTFVGDLLGPRWNLLNNISLCFILYILTYAYISGGGSIVAHTIKETFGFNVPIMLSGMLFSFGLAFCVWYGTAFVGRLSTILVAGMFISFLLSVQGFVLHIEIETIFSSKPEYLIYTLAAIPYFMTSFGYHGCVPSLIKHYSSNVRMVKSCLLFGSIVVLSFYLIWLVSTLGNIPREEFSEINASGGNIGDLVNSLRSKTDAKFLGNTLAIFANMAVISSFLGVTLGLFDFIADKFNFLDNSFGRFKTAIITFLPPTLGELFFPNGFIYAIGLAGMFACIFGSIVPALAAKHSRLKYGSPKYQVWGGNSLITVIICYGTLQLVCYVGATFNFLPKF